ncbi:MAG: hypothetical protein U1F68_11830 [Gammaproteobacteria bacterium]
MTKDDGVTSATAGGNVTYTLVASNSSPSDAAGATVADTFPASLTCTWTCAGAGGGTCAASGAGNINDTVNLPTGGSATTPQAAPSAPPRPTGSLINTASITAPAGVTDPTPGNNSATDTDGLGATADLSITKDDGVTSATAGSSVTYTLVASNTGPSNATGTTVADTFPASLTCTWTCTGAGGGTCTASGAGNINDTANLPAGGSATYTASCAISAAATGTLSNTATVTAPGGVTDPTPGNNSATDSDTVSLPVTDIFVDKGIQSATVAGGTLIYLIGVSNLSVTPAPAVTVIDNLPPVFLNPTWTCTVSVGAAQCGAASGTGNLNDVANLPVNSQVQYFVTGTVDPAATGTLSNTASITVAGAIDSNPANNTSTATSTITRRADLAITKTNGVTSVAPGGNTTYTITAHNSGPSGITGATVADAFPASLTCTWTCAGTGGGACAASGTGNINDATVNLPPNANVTYTANCAIAAAATGSLVNTATVTPPAGVVELNPSNDSATDTDAITALTADLAITKTDGVTSAAPGGNVTYTLVASNATGPNPVTGATVADTFPASLTCTWTCAGTGGGAALPLERVISTTRA